MATASVLGFAQSAHSAPDPETCSGSGSTKTCTFQGNQSSGINTSNVAADAAIVNVKNLSVDMGYGIALARERLESLSKLTVNTGQQKIQGTEGIQVITDVSVFPSATADSPNGRSGKGLTLDFAGRLNTTGYGQSSAIALQEDGRGGYSFSCTVIGTNCKKTGGAGGAGAAFDLYARGEIDTDFANAIGIFSKGGAGGDASLPFALLDQGATGGAGGKGGHLRFFTSGKFEVFGPTTGLLLSSTGGSGGKGSKGTAGGRGGAGGAGGDLLVDTGEGSLRIQTYVDGPGISLKTTGGNGGIGGDNVTAKGLPGGAGGAGGRIDINVDSTLSVSTGRASAPGLYLVTQGGRGASGGENTSTASANDGGAGGNGGAVYIALNPDYDPSNSDALPDALTFDIETFLDDSAGIEAYSIAGSGGDAGSNGGKGAGGAAGVGGALTFDAPWSVVDISTAGAYSRGINLSSQGASGGRGSDGTFWVPQAGAGGDATQGGNVSLNLGDALAPGAALASTITTLGTDSAAIYLESIGGGKGGNAGDKGGVFVSAGSAGNGGGITAQIGAGVTLETHGMDSSGVAALSVGGSGGSGGSTKFLFGGLAGDGAIGGKGGSITVSSAASIDTYGIASAGIRAQSLGGSGGNGGSATAGLIDVGGDAGAGGDGGTVSVGNTGDIYTHYAEGEDSQYINPACVSGCAYGIFAQSVGGNGGMGGDAKGLFVGLGGSGGGDQKSQGGLVSILHSGTITTEQQSSAGIYAQSVGGGGGVAGTTWADGVVLEVAIGADGGGGGDGGTVQISLLDAATNVTTTENDSAGIKATSIGGGGGSSGSTQAVTGSFLGGVSVAVGGSGSAGGDGGSVEVIARLDKDVLANGVTSVPVTLITYGDRSHGIEATSTGGGGGDSSHTGAMTVVAGETSVSIAVAVGGSGGAGGAGGAVTVDLASAALDIQTTGFSATGIRAVSTSDGGGTSGTTATLAAGISAAPVNIGVAVGGSGGSGGDSGAVTIITPVAGAIGTQGETAYGIYASSISGGGGDATVTSSTALLLGTSGGLNAPIAVGACANVDAKSCKAFSGDSGAITVTNSSGVTTAGVAADGIHASSISGGGGNAGSVMTSDISLNLGSEPAPNLSVSVGGNGGRSGVSGDVTVTNTGAITASGAKAVGIYAESISGSGGSGASTQNFSATLNSIPIVVGVGGKGGTSGKAGNVTVTNSGVIVTGTSESPVLAITDYEDGTSSVENHQNEHGIFAQSLGGGGGEGGSTVSFNASLQTSSSTALSAQVTVGGSGGEGGAAGKTTVTNSCDVTLTNSCSESITTYSQSSDAIRALSYGGGGGLGGAAINTLFAASTSSNLIQASVSVGGAGASGATGGDVAVTNEGQLKTVGDDSRGVFAESIGGGGGEGGATGNVAFAVSPTSTGRSFALQVQVGGNGGTGNHGGAVVVKNSGNVTTLGKGSQGLYARSIGGGGGTGGTTGTSPDWNNVLEVLGLTITDALDAYSASSFIKNLIVGGTTKTSTALQVNVGGIGGASGDGGDVMLTLDDGDIVTEGGQSNGVEAISIGGGGGDGGSGSGGFSTLASVGGKGGAAGNGGDVLITVSAAASIETFGDVDTDAEAAAHGIFAQSVGGGGGTGGDAPLSGIVSSFQENMLAWVPNWNTLIPEDAASRGVGVGFTFAGNAGGGGQGGDVKIDSSASITTHSFGSYGIFAQSVGGGGGTVGLSAVSLLSLAGVGAGIDLAADSVSMADVAWGPTETVSNYNGSVYGYGSAGNLNITSSGAITTDGKYAHGIYAQSAAGISGEYDSRGASVGGDILIDASDVYANGTGSVAILAQSMGGDGNGNINITTRGTISAGMDAAAVQLMEGYQNVLTNVAGGLIGCTPRDDTPCIAVQTIHSSQPFTIENTNSAGLCDGKICPEGKDPDVVPLEVTPWKPFSFDLQNFGTITGEIKLSEVELFVSDVTPTVLSGNRVVNHATGVITGGVDLGPTCASSSANLACSFDNYGTWNPSSSIAASYSAVGPNSLNNFGTINITGPTTIDGSFKHQAGGNLSIALDPDVHFSQPALTVTGLARLEGTITPVISSLRKGDFKLLQAGTLEGTPQVTNPLLFDWQAVQTAGGELRLSALADFQPAGLQLSSNARRVTDYLKVAWDQGEDSLSGHFARMLAIPSGDAYVALLEGFAGAPLLHQHTAILQALPTLLSDTLECPTGGAKSIVAGGSCLWIKGGQQWGRYSGNDTRSTEIDSDFYGFGGQKEVRPGWFLSGAVGRFTSDSKADNYRSSGDTTVGSVGLRHQSGPWTLGAAVALASGSYDGIRYYAMPSVAGTALSFAGSSSVLYSDSDLDVRSLRLHASREFALDGWYVRPVLNIDLTETEMPGFEEEGPLGAFALRVDGNSERNFAVAPHLEIGSVRPFGKASRLRMYLDLGVRLNADADRDVAYALDGVSEASGYVRQQIDVPFATGVLKAGAQIFRQNGLDLRLEYGLSDNGDLRSQSATATLGWQF